MQDRIVKYEHVLEEKQLELFNRLAFAFNFRPRNVQTFRSRLGGGHPAVRPKDFATLARI